jgi:hypothetical protein
MANPPNVAGRDFHGLSGLSDLLLFAAMKKNRPRLADFGFASNARARIFAVRFCNTY